MNPRRTSTTCPRYDGRLKENGYRKMKCTSCGFEEDRDVVAVLNIEKRATLKMEGTLTPLTAPQMNDVAPNGCGEPVNRLVELRPLRLRGDRP